MQICSLVWPRIAIVNLSVDNPKEQNTVVVENNAPPLRSLPRSDPVLMQPSETSPFGHIHTDCYYGELRQIFCHNHVSHQFLR